MLGKSQVKALLEVMGADESRPGLCQAVIDTFDGRLVLVATNGYMLVALNLPAVENGVTKARIPREDIVRWYKLAGARDMFNPQELVQPILDDSPKFPKWQGLFEGKQPESVDSLAFNANYALTLEKLAGEPLRYTLHGALGMMRADTIGGMYVLMPLNPSKVRGSR